MQYGKCLTPIYKHKAKYAELLYESFLLAQKSEATFDFSFILKNDKNSWKFYWKSLGYIYMLQKQLKNALKYEETGYKKIIIPILENLQKNCTKNEYENFLNPNFLLTYAKFAETIDENLINHIYIESESLLDFLTTVEVKNITDLKKFIVKNGKIKENKGIISFAFHLPNWDNGVSLHLDFSENDNNFLFYALHGKDFGFKKITEENALKEINESDYLKMLFNSLCYTECFAENVRDGVPADLKEKTQKNEKSKTLTPFKEIENFTKKDITAHFRHAHFRFCGSDFYKAKKGKWVFVKGSMVNAEAKTIIEEE